MPDRQLFRVHASVVVQNVGGQVLFVQEAKPANRGRWNLPGGHVDHGEAIPMAAARELREETGLELALSGLVGIYSSLASVRFVFTAEVGGQSPVAGHEILAVRWFDWNAVLGMDGDQLVAPEMVGVIAKDVAARLLAPIRLFSETIFPRQKEVEIPLK